MAITDTYLRLVCGDEELNLHDKSVAWLAQQGFVPSPPPYSIALTLKEAAAMARYSRFARQVERFARYAKEYEQNNRRRGNPVYVRYKWDQAGPLPLMGAGALQHRVKTLSVAYPRDLHTQGYFASPTLPGLVMTVEEGDPYWTDTVKQPLGIGTGGLVEHRRSAGPWRDDMGLQVAEATVNQILNPIAGAAGNFAANNGATVTRSDLQALYGDDSYRVTAVAGANSGLDLTTAALANAIHYVSFRVKTVSTWAADMADLTITVDGGANEHAVVELGTEEDDEGEEWTVYGAEIPAAQCNGSTTTSILLDKVAAEVFYIDGVQAEEKDYPTPLATGDMGPGHSWGSTANGSATTRTAASLHYDDHVTDLVQPIGSACGWYTVGSLPSDIGSITYLFDARGADNNNRIYAFVTTADKFSLTSNTSALVAAIGSGSLSWGDRVFWCATWDYETNLYTLTVYEEDGTSYTDSAATALSYPTLTDLGLGNSFALAAPINGCLDDMRFYDEVLDSDEIAAIYNATRETKRGTVPVIIGVPPYIWTSAGSGTITNRFDATGENRAVIGTARGDTPSGLQLQILGSAVIFGDDLVAGLRHAGFPDFVALLDEYNADSKNAAYGADAADANYNEGFKFHVTVDPADNYILRWDLHSAAGGPECYYGRFHAYAKAAQSLSGAFELAIGSNAFTGDPVSIGSGHWWDLGEISLPDSRPGDGIAPSTMYLWLYADMIVAGQTLDVDYVLLVPVDDEGHLVFDSISDNYQLSATNALLADSISDPPNWPVIVASTGKFAGQEEVLGLPMYASTIGPSRFQAIMHQDGAATITATMTLSGYILPSYQHPPDV